MIYQNLTHQLQHVRAALAAPTTDASRAVARQTLPGRIAALVRATPNAPEPDGPIGERLALELCYAVTRHRDALDAPVFGELLAAHLEQAYRLRPEVAESLVLQACDEAAEAFEVSLRRPDDADAAFLRSVCVACAAADDDRLLARELGLGAPLLTRVRIALTSLAHSSAEDDNAAENTTKVHFVPAVEAKLAMAVIALARELTAEPDALDHQRLSRALSEVSPRWRRKDLPCSIAALHKVLAVMGAVTTWSESELCGQLQLLTQEPDDELASELASADVLSLDDNVGGSSRTTRRRWRLGTLGLSVTASAVARALTATMDLDIGALSAMPALYQAAIVRNWPRSHLDELSCLVSSSSTETRPLAPSALALAIARLADYLPHLELAQTTMMRVQNEPSPWLRAAALQALERFLTQPYVGQTLIEVARSDPSPHVRGAALEILARHEPGSGPRPAV